MNLYIILEIRDRSQQVVFAAEDRADGDEGVAQIFTELAANREVERIRQYYPHFRFQIVKLDVP